MACPSSSCTTFIADQDATAQGKHNHLTTYVFQPLIFNGTAISLPTYKVSSRLDVGAGTF